MDSALAGLLNQASAHLNAGAVPGRMGNRHPSIAPYETFAAADGEFAVAVGNDAIFGRLCEVVGRAHLAGDARFATNAARMEHRDELAAELEAAFATAPAADWVTRLADAGVPAGPDQRRGPGLRLRRRARPRARRRDRRRAHRALAAAPRRDAGGGEPPAAAPGRALGRDPSLARDGRTSVFPPVEGVGPTFDAPGGRLGSALRTRARRGSATSSRWA